MRTIEKRMRTIEKRMRTIEVIKANFRKYEKSF
jgi:midasin (ATPase involved in ribosome maturation)